MMNPRTALPIRHLLVFSYESESFAELSGYQERLNRVIGNALFFHGEIGLSGTFHRGFGNDSGYREHCIGCLKIGSGISSSRSAARWCRGWRRVPLGNDRRQTSANCSTTTRPATASASLANCLAGLHGRNVTVDLCQRFADRAGSLPLSPSMNSITLAAASRAFGLGRPVAARNLPPPLATKHPDCVDCHLRRFLGIGIDARYCPVGCERAKPFVAHLHVSLRTTPTRRSRSPD